MSLTTWSKKNYRVRGCLIWVLLDLIRFVKTISQLKYAY